MRKLHYLAALLVIGAPAWVAAQQASPEAEQATAAAQVDEIFSAYAASE